MSKRRHDIDCVLLAFESWFVWEEEEAEKNYSRLRKGNNQANKIQ
jgi:hypothetical protein